MKKILLIVILFFSFNVFSQEDPFNCDEIFSYNLEDHVSAMADLGFSMESENENENSYTFMNGDESVSVIVFLDDSLVNTIGICFLMTDNQNSFQLLAKTDKCEKMKYTSSDGMNQIYEFDGDKHDLLIEFSHKKIDNGRFLSIITLVKNEK